MASTSMRPRRSDRRWGTPRSPYDLPGDVRVTCDVLVAPLVQLTLIMDPRVGIGEEY